LSQEFQQAFFVGHNMSGLQKLGGIRGLASLTWLRGRHGQYRGGEPGSWNNAASVAHRRLHLLSRQDTAAAPSEQSHRMKTRFIHVLFIASCPRRGVLRRWYANLPRKLGRQGSLLFTETFL
jgi:hypothetical protein